MQPYFIDRALPSDMTLRSDANIHFKISSASYLGTPKGHNFSLKRKNRLLGSQAEILV